MTPGDMGAASGGRHQGGQRRGREGAEGAPCGLVARYVDTYEVWEQVPAGWAQHSAMLNELPAAMEVRLAIGAETAGDMLASVRGRAGWYDYRGRLIGRLAASPGAV